MSEVNVFFLELLCFKIVNFCFLGIVNDKLFNIFFVWFLYVKDKCFIDKLVLFGWIGVFVELFFFLGSLLKWWMEFL